MAYTPKNPRFDSTIFTDQGVAAVTNPASGSHKLIDRSGAFYVRDSSGIETQLLSGAAGTLYSEKSADYTILDNDNIRTVGMTTGSTNRTVTLPTVADNTSRIITVKKVDSGTGTVTIDGEGSETIDGALTVVLTPQFDSVTVQSSGTDWKILVHDLGVVPGVTAGLVAAAGLKGKTNGVAYAASYVGEVMRTSWTGASLGTSPALFGTLNLTAGVWHVRLTGKSEAGSATRVLMSISLASGALDTTMYGETIQDSAQKLSSGYNPYYLSKIVNISATTPHYAVGQSVTASSTLHDGLFEAVRIA